MLSRYDVISPLLPFRGVPSSNLHSTMNRLFQDFEAAFTRPIGRSAVRSSNPRVQLRDLGDAIALLADLPGLRLEDVELSVVGEVVTLKTKAPSPQIPEGYTALRRERQLGACEWSFELPYPIDAAAASASLEQGRLSVTLPKAPEAKPFTIPVKAG
jgi:HSP20 family protein